MKIKAAIIGLGNIGKRHLQAISKLNSLEKIQCFDIDKNALDSVFSFCKENGSHFNNIELTMDFEKILKEITKDTLVIIATTAKGRKQLIEKVIIKNPLAIISEKPLCQSLEEYDEIKNLSKRNNVHIYVNFNRRLFPVYQQLRKEIEEEEGKEGKVFKSVFSGGMSCSGIHLMELVTWLFNVKNYRILYSKNISVFESKRKGYYDFAGEMILALDKKNLCCLKATEADNLFSIAITTKGKEYTIYENVDKIVISDISGNVKISPIKKIHTSETTDKVFTQIAANKNTSLLPDIYQAYLAHKMLFDYMQFHGQEKVNIT